MKIIIQEECIRNLYYLNFVDGLFTFPYIRVCRSSKLFGLWWRIF